MRGYRQNSRTPGSAGGAPTHYTHRVSVMLREQWPMAPPKQWVQALPYRLSRGAGGKGSGTQRALWLSHASRLGEWAGGGLPSLGLAGRLSRPSCAALSARGPEASPGSHRHTRQGLRERGGDPGAATRCTQRSHPTWGALGCSQHVLSSGRCCAGSGKGTPCSVQLRGSPGAPATARPCSRGCFSLSTSVPSPGRWAAHPLQPGWPQPADFQGRSGRGAPGK